jgi:glutathione synthase/RimK-type ligase-like ATP-grasp enzyme
MGLPLAGVDLAAENGGVVFEVNVHPMFGSVRGLQTVAVPYVQAHLRSRRMWASTSTGTSSNTGE